MKTGGLSPRHGQPGAIASGPVSSSRQGSIVVYALIILAVCSLVLAGWVNVMSGVAEYSEATRDGITRRLNVENSRNMAVQYLRESVLTGTSTVGITNSNISWTVGGTSYFIGGVTIPTLSGTSNVLVTTNQPVRWNPFSPAGTSWGTTYFSGFSANTTNAVLHDGTGTTSWTIQARSRAPIFGYDTVELPRYSGTSNLALNLPAPAALGTSVGSFTSGGLLNVALPPDRPPTVNFPAYAGSTTPIGSSHVSVTSFTSTQANGDHNFAPNRAARLWTGTTGEIAVIYPYRDPNPNSPSARVYNITGTSTSQIQILADSGTVAIANPSLAPPILIQCSATNTPLRITIFRGNVRPIYLRINNQSTCTVVVSSVLSPAGASVNTRLSALFGGTGRLQVQAASGTINGGFHALTTSSGSLRAMNEAGTATQTLNIMRDTTTLQTSGQLLEFMANRNAWVELYQND